MLNEHQGDTKQTAHHSPTAETKDKEHISKTAKEKILKMRAQGSN